MQFLEFWEEADREAKLELEGEAEGGDHYPWSPPMLLRCLKQYIEWLQTSIDGGDEEDAYSELVQIAQLAATISVSLDEWRFGRGHWFRIDRQERLLTFVRDDGKEVHYLVSDLGHRKVSITYQEGDEATTELEVVSEGQPLADAMRTYLEVELQRFSEHPVHTRMIPILQSNKK